MARTAEKETRRPARKAETRVDVYQYLDYRRFLRDAHEVRKKSAGKYSFRYFAEKAGVGSPSYLKAVMDGKRNLTPDTARGFARALGLNKQQTRYFVALVAMNQAKTTRDRTFYFEELSSIPKFRETRQLERNQYEYYTRWYCVVIRELAARDDFREDPQWIAGQVRPAITPRQAEEALGLLQALNLLKRDEAGRLVQADPLLTTGPELHSLATRSFHREMLYRAAAALDEVPLEEREVGGVTVRLGKEQVQLLKRRLFEIRQEVLGLEGKGEGKEAVYHYAFQLFPVSRANGEGG